MTPPSDVAVLPDEVALAETANTIRRKKTPAFATVDSPFRIGRAELMRDDDDLTILACGPLVYEALLAAQRLHTESIEARVLDCHTIKPINVSAIVAKAHRARARKRT